MPCSKGMRRCKRGCLHRQLVEEYRIARHCDVLNEEARTLGGRGERELEKENYSKTPITFREWIKGAAHSQEYGET